MSSDSCCRHQAVLANDTETYCIPSKSTFSCVKHLSVQAFMLLCVSITSGHTSVLILLKRMVKHPLLAWAAPGAACALL